MDRPNWVPPDVDVTRPSVARLYDYHLGGSHNFESDRAFGDRTLRTMPDLPELLRDNRDFLRRVVRELCALGVDQFLDLGSGIPTVGNVHEVARASTPGARVVCVDHDAVAVAHGRALLADDPQTAAVLADVREPDVVLAAVRRTCLIDFSRPVGVLMIALLHFAHDEDRPRELVADYMGGLPVGSYPAIGHGRADGSRGIRNAAAVYEGDRSPNPMRLRSAAEVVDLFGSLTLLDPGVVLLPRRHPDAVDDRRAGSAVADDYPGFGGLGRRD
ncbi:SAM-dependent methyltransferase [Pseudonocardia lacus]|uniref:SAM-dependent methyltransferase n=1 Tax=Pseudonocardia lacus TaxID=2835865 RepID=UPI001BDCBBE1|nr:SAM-dependent methyltransferase [Pseudonocardia lacus]